MNECSRDPPPCHEDQYCLNTDGSYSCRGRPCWSLLSSRNKGNNNNVDVCLLPHSLWDSLFWLHRTWCWSVSELCWRLPGLRGHLHRYSWQYILRSSGNPLKACRFFNSFEWFFFFHWRVLSVVVCPLEINLLTGSGDRCERVFPAGSCVHGGEPGLHQHSRQLHVHLLGRLWGERWQVCPHCTTRLV